MSTEERGFSSRELTSIGVFTVLATLIGIGAYQIGFHRISGVQHGAGAEMSASQGPAPVNGQALYAGPGLGLEPHSGSVWCLAVGVDAPLTVTVGAASHVVRAALIPPRLTHHLAVDGRLVLYVERGGKTLLTFTDDEPLALAFRALADAVRRGALGRLTIEKADGVGALGNDSVRIALEDAGFVATSKGLRIRA